MPDRYILTLNASQAIMLMLKHDRKRNGHICQTQWSSLYSLLIKASVFELVHIGEEDEILERRER